MFSSESEFSTHFEHVGIHVHLEASSKRVAIYHHFQVTADMRRDINDVTLIYGADIGSDHHLVLM